MFYFCLQPKFPRRKKKVWRQGNTLTLIAVEWGSGTHEDSSMKKLQCYRERKKSVVSCRDDFVLYQLVRLIDILRIPSLVFFKLSQLCIFIKNIHINTPSVKLNLDISKYNQCEQYTSKYILNIPSYKGVIFHNNNHTSLLKTM